ncbi:MAG: molybdenum ABC transporter ATP-binding protein [Bradyrhizobiaceae bacterium]|nr:molybdenum ABC transporter ATP-binding protein [Bradyrhizobiaceae bacterium]
MIEVRVRKKLGDFQLDAAFKSDANVTAISGPSGSGKSTLLGAIAGLLRPDEGFIAFDGRTLFDSARRISVPAHRRGIRVVFQDSRLFPHLTVRQNLLYGYWLAGRRSHRTLDEIVALLGIGHLLKRRPRTLSGGERQRVALGRALLANPTVLLLDEPLASLDQERKDDVLPYLRQLVSASHIPILYVSHQRDEIEALAQRVIRLEGGRVVNGG